jgi:hypothetical protein
LPSVLMEALSFVPGMILLIHQTHKIVLPFQLLQVSLPFCLCHILSFKTQLLYCHNFHTNLQQFSYNYHSFFVISEY